jgi:ATP-dependent Clp protease ATP-binding subunit ClpA/ATP-dependent Clp protease ATP-binding subunit ClpC
LRLPEASAFLDELQRSDALSTLSERIHLHLQRHTQGSLEDAEPLFTLDQVRAEILDFRTRIDELSVDETEAEASFAMRKFQYLTVAGNSDRREPEERVRMFDRREIAMPARPVRERMLAALAEVQFLGRVLESIDDPNQHAIFIELLQVHHGVSATRFARNDAHITMISEMVTAFTTHRGQVDEWAAVVEDRVETGRGGGAIRELTKSARPSMVILKLVGVCVLDFFELDTGCHVWNRLSTTPEILRIKVTPAPLGVTPFERMSRHREAKIAFEKAIEKGVSPLPENPEALLPVVRRFRFDPPGDGAPPTTLEVEDFPLGYTTMVRRSRLSDALPFLWQLRMSRRSPGPASVPASKRSPS